MALKRVKVSRKIKTDIVTKDFSSKERSTGHLLKQIVMAKLFVKGTINSEDWSREFPYGEDTFLFS